MNYTFKGNLLTTGVTAHMMSEDGHLMSQNQYFRLKMFNLTRPV